MPSRRRSKCPSKKTRDKCRSPCKWRKGSSRRGTRGKCRPPRRSSSSSGRRRKSTRRKTCASRRSEKSCRRAKKSCKYSRTEKKCKPRKATNPTKKLLNEKVTTLGKFGLSSRPSFKLTRALLTSAEAEIVNIPMGGTRPDRPQLKIKMGPAWLNEISKSSDKAKLRDNLAAGQTVYNRFLSNQQQIELGDIIRGGSGARSEGAVYTDVSDTESEDDE